MNTRLPLLATFLALILVACPSPPTQDTTPDAFTFTAQTTEPNTSTISNAIVVSGIDAPSSVNVAGGEYSINDGAYTNAASTVQNGFRIKLRLTSGTFSEAKTATLDVGGVQGNFKVTTRAANTTPTDFSFTEKTNAAPNTLTESNTIVVAGTEVGVGISVTGGEYKIGAGDNWVSAPGNAAPNSSIEVRLSSGQFGESKTATLTLGNKTAQFKVTARAANTTPTDFSFTEKTNAEPNIVTESNTIVVAGTEIPVNISVVGGEYKIGAGDWTTSAATVAPGLSIQVRLSNGNFSESKTATLTLGNKQAQFKVTTRAAKITPKDFLFAPKENAELSTAYTSNTVLISGIEIDVPISIVGDTTTSNAQYSISIDGTNFGNWSSAPSTIKNGYSIRVRANSEAGTGATNHATLSVGPLVSVFGITTKGPRTQPDDFSFVAKTNSEPTTASNQNFSESEAITITGIEAPSVVSIVGGEYQVSIDGGTSFGAYRNNASTVSLHNLIRVRVLNAQTFSGTTSTTLNIGGKQATFTATNRVADTEANAFAFTAQTNKTIATQIVSNSITVTGLENTVANFQTDIAIVGGEYNINGGAFTSTAGKVKNNDVVMVRQNSSNNFSDTTTSTLTIGIAGKSSSASFAVTTEAKDTTPTAFAFVANTSAGVKQNNVESNEITIAGINAPTDISIVGGEYSLNAGPYISAAGTTKNGDKIKVRASAGYGNEKKTTTLSAGGVTANFDVIAKENDTLPMPNSGPNTSPLTFADLSDQALSSDIVSNIITLTEFDSLTPISIVGGEYSLDGGTTWTSAAGTAKPEDKLQLRLKSSSLPGKITTAVVNLGKAWRGQPIDSSTCVVPAPIPAPTPDPCSNPNTWIPARSESFSVFTSTTGFMFSDELEHDFATTPLATSNEITVLKAGTISVTGNGAAYSVNGGAMQNTASTVVAGDKVKVQASQIVATGKAEATLTIGTDTDTFTAYASNSNQFAITLRNQPRMIVDGMQGGSFLNTFDRFGFYDGGNEITLTNFGTVTLPPSLAGRTIKNVKLRLKATHPFRADLKLQLQGPTGLPVTLFDWKAGETTGSNYYGQNFNNLTFTDSATTTAMGATGCGSLNNSTWGSCNGEIKPKESLAAFVGKSPSGTWSFLAGDSSPEDVGTIDEVEIIFELDPVIIPSPVIASFTANTSTVAANNAITIPSPGGLTTLAWNVTGATSIAIDQNVGVVSGTSKDVNLNKTTTFTLTATNAGGSSTKTVTVNVSAPAAPIILAPTAAANLNTAAPIISGTAQKDTSIKVLEGASTVCSATTDATGAWACSSATLTEGAHNIFANATDVGANTSANSANTTFTVDTVPPTAPTIASSTPSSSPTTPSNNPTPTLTGTSEANASIVVKNGSTQICTATANAIGAWTCNTSALATSALAEGTNNLTSTATDAAGNTSPASTIFVYTLDSVAPTAPVVLQPSEGASISLASGGFNLLGNAEADSVISIKEGATIIANTNTSGAGSWDASTPGSPFAVGAHTITITAKDAAGNISAPTTINFTVTP